MIRNTYKVTDMKNVFIAIAFMIVCGSLAAQTINNTSAKVHVPDGTYVKFNNLINTGSGALFYYNTDLSIAGNWTNTAPAVFNSGPNSSVIFNGSTQQIITSGGSQFRHVTFNNNSAGNYAIVINDDMSIAGSLTLTDGIVNGNGNKLIFLAGSSCGAGSSSAFIDGAVQKDGATAFSFPLGNINSRDLDGDLTPEDYVIWAPVDITPSVSTSVTIQYYFDNTGMPDWWEHGGNMDESLHHVSDREYWVINSSQDLTSVTLHWKNNAHGVGEICVHSLCDGNDANYDPADLSLAYFDGMWIDMGGLASFSHDEGVISSGPIPFSAKGSKFVTFGSKNNIDPLPIELLSFASICNGNGVDLLWQTASEINSYGFDIEKSLDGINFEKIGFVAGAGNSNAVLDYRFTDSKNQPVAKYYRLKLVDIDGSFKYSNIVTAYCYEESSPVIMVYPNPFHDFFYVKGENLDCETTTIQVYDMLGKMLWTNRTENTFGMFQQEVNLSDVSPAMYTVRVICGDFIKTFKIDKH